MRKFLIVLLALGWSHLACAGTFLRYGLNFAEPGVNVGDEKTFSLGYEEDWFGPFIHQYEVGIYSAHGDGKLSSGFATYSVGVEVRPGVFVARSLWGFGVITTPDALLGGWFQFNQDLFLGIRDDRGCMIGFDLKHFSSGGLENPNYGRQAALVQVEIPW